MSNRKRTCRHCGAEFSPSYSARTFCTSACRFWASVDRRGENDCWPWNGACNHGGYGRFRNAPASRFSYELHYGPLMPGLLICHACDNPICVNPKHLFAGTYADNRRDCLQKQRQATGERVGGAKLNAESVYEIRRLHAAGEMGRRRLAAKFGVTHQAVARILKRETWKEVA